MGQSIPDVRVNHLYLVIDAADLATIQMSDYVKHRLVAVETRTTRTGEGRSWTGTYLYGKDNYFELFGPDYANVGRSGIGFSVDNPGDIHALKGCLENKYKVSIFRRDRDIDGTGIPWFDSLSIDDPVFHSDSLVGFWDNFRFVLKERSPNGTRTIESLEFETATMLDKETRGLSGNVSVVIDGDKGRLLFEDLCSLP